MKFSWKDVMTTILAVFGAAIVYAKFYNFSWGVIGSWRSAVLVLAAASIVLFAFSSFDFSNLSILNIGEMVLGIAALILAIVGTFVTSQFAFYSLAVVMGVFWLLDIARHARHSLVGETTTSFHHHAQVR
jgi:hypothetical protein